MANNIDIVVLDDPTIELEELSIIDMESHTDNQEVQIDSASNRSVTAYHSPIVKIKDFIISAEYLQEFTLDCTGFEPECTISFIDNTKQFSEKNYPSAGDIMKVYISTGGKEDTWKPIRIDFHILTISPFEDDEATGFTISAEMDIPTFELDKCETFKNTSSFDACRQIAKNLKLGFSSNIQSTNDAQNWINNYKTDKQFLNKLAKHAYYDENSFITAYIDPYYYLNFVECNAIINDADNDDNTIENLQEIKYIDMNINTDPEFADEEENTAPDFLTNSNEYISSNIGIVSYAPINNIGEIVHKNGYKIYTRYWDDNEEEYRIEFITPFISEGTNLKQMNTITDEQTIKEHTKKITMRAQTDNVHKNYNYAEICNALNLEEIDKYGLSITIPGFNPAITRFQKKYIAIYTHNIFVKSDVLTEEEESEGQSTTQLDDVILNETLSGFYTITGITYNLVENTLFTNVELRKRAIKQQNSNE